MSAKRPLVKTFRTQDNYYIYDVKSNRILRVSGAMNDIIELFPDNGKDEIVRLLSDRYSAQEIDEAFSRIKTLSQDHNLFSPGPLRQRVGRVRREDIVEQLSQGAGILTLEVTEACNMRCRYCIFSGEYEYSRPHGHQSMLLSTAKAAIDFHLAKNEMAESLSIGFYGGEPLLEFDLIKECCEYVRSCERKRETKRGTLFSLTTNGTLLTDERIDFFIENDFALTISIDGPREIHDQYRVFPNGSGSFAPVFEGIQRIYEKDQEYFQRRMLFNCVIAPSSNFVLLQQFFDQHSHLFGGKLSLASVSPGHPTFFKQYPTYPNRDRDFTTLHEQYCIAHVNGETTGETFYNSFIRQLFEQDYLFIARRFVFDEGKEELNRVNVCVPGQRKVFVDVNGRLHICERMNRHFPIGDVWSGYDVDRITALFNEFNGLMNSDECKNCWAVHFCPLCFTVGENGGFSKDIMYERCAQSKKWKENVLLTYCAILEKNPQAFDYMEAYVIS